MTQMELLDAVKAGRLHYDSIRAMMPELVKQGLSIEALTLPKTL